jgi:hypothetical protein
MDPGEVLIYKDYLKKHHKRRLKYWRHSLLKSIKYTKRPFMVNAHLLEPTPPSLDDSFSESSDDEEQEKQGEDVMEKRRTVRDQHVEEIIRHGLKKGVTKQFPSTKVKKKMEEEEVWVLPVFMRAGKNSYLVKYQYQDYAHKVLTPFREEDIPVCKL